MWSTVWMDSNGLNGAGAGMYPKSRKPVMEGLRRQCPGRERGVVGPLGSSDPLAENGHGAGTRQAQHVCEHAHTCSQLLLIHLYRLTRACTCLGTLHIHTPTHIHTRILHIYIAHSHTHSYIHTHTHSIPSHVQLCFTYTQMHART